MTSPRWRPLVAPVVALALACAGVACGDKVQPVGSKLVTDVPPPPPAPEPPDASVQPLLDGAYDDALVDGYAPFDASFAACAGCVCPPETSYCFAGATTRAPGDAGEGGTPACTVSSASPPTVGCNTLPAACTAKPSCACVIDALQPLYRCYLNCQTTGDGFLVYCPNP